MTHEPRFQSYVKEIDNFPVNVHDRLKEIAVRGTIAPQDLSAKEIQMACFALEVHCWKRENIEDQKIVYRIC